MDTSETRHLDVAELFRLVRIGAAHPHLSVCSFCREQFEEVRELEEFRPESAEPALAPPWVSTTARASYRLAAQDQELEKASHHPRRTWYLEDGAVVLRVMEDEQHARIFGHLIISPDRLATVRVRFSGIDKDFTPSADGVFDIGESALGIERMDAHLLD